jgi:hypothetical protein
MSKRRRQLVDLGGDENEGGGSAGGGAAIGFNYDSEDPIAAAIARRAAKEKKCALGGLLGAYVDDDDEEEEEETDGASKEPPHPWKKLRDATTGHDYYWNQDDGSVSWTLPSAGDATKAAGRDSGDAGDDAPVAELKIPIPKPDVRTFADLLPGERGVGAARGDRRDARAGAAGDGHRATRRRLRTDQKRR